MNILSMIISWVVSHPALGKMVIVAIYEVIVRKTKTNVSISVLDFVKTVVDEICPNKIVKEIADESIEKIEEGQKKTEV